MNFNKKSLYLIGLSISVLALTGCETPNIDPIGQNNYENYAPKDSSQQMDSNQNLYQKDQYITYNSSIVAETKKFNTENDTLIKIIKDNNGIVKSQNNFQYQDYVLEQNFVQSDLVIDVPKDNYSKTIQQIKKTFHISNFNESSLDVTDTKLTTEENIKLIEDDIKQLESSLKDKEISSDEKTAIRSEIRNLEREKLSLEKSLKSTDEEIAYSTIQFTLKEVPHYSDEKPSVWYNFRQAFSGFIGQAISIIAYSLLSLLFFIPFAIFLAFVYLVTRKSWYKWVQKGINSGKFNPEIISKKNK